MLKSEARYKGAQSLCKVLGSDGCYVLCLLSIAEDATGQQFDLLDTVRLLLSKGIIREDMYVLDAPRFLQLLTGHEWRRLPDRKVLGPVAENEYSIEKYRNGSAVHFRRRPYDVYTNSVTVAMGEIDCYYVFEEIK